MTTTEVQFRAQVRQLIVNGRYPEHGLLLGVRGRNVTQMRSGLTREQTRWRRLEVEAAGYDWEASKRSRSLIKSKR